MTVADHPFDSAALVAQDVRKEPPVAANVRCDAREAARRTRSEPRATRRGMTRAVRSNDVNPRRSVLNESVAPPHGSGHLRLVFTGLEAAGTGEDENRESDWFSGSPGSRAAAAVVLLGGLNRARAYSRERAVLVSSVAEEFCVPVDALLAAAAGLRSESLAVLRRDDSAGIRLWIGGKSEVEAHARRLRAEASECRRRAADFKRQAASMRA